MTEQCNLETIKAGILDAMMRFTDAYHNFTTHRPDAPPALESTPGVYIAQIGFSRVCEVCVLGSLLCGRLAEPSAGSLHQVGRRVRDDWNLIPRSLPCFSARTLAVLEAIYEADSPYHRADTGELRAIVFEAWADADLVRVYTEEETVEEGGMLAGMAPLEPNERILAALQYLYERGGELDVGDISRFGDVAFAAALAEKGLTAAAKAAKAYIAAQVEAECAAYEKAKQ